MDMTNVNLTKDEIRLLGSLVAFHEEATADEVIKRQKLNVDLDGLYYKLVKHIRKKR